MKTFIPFVILLGAVLLSSCNTVSTQNESASTTTEITGTATAGVELIQFHSEHRCMTCNKIESMTIATAESFEGITFRLVNVDDDANAAMAREFEAAGTALYLYNPESGKKKELTDFAFMNAHDEEKYIAKLREEIVGFE
jgi:putative N-acetylmannosamine-6-phosphate epimerase